MGGFAGPTNSWINKSSENSLNGLVTDGLVLALDAGRTLSYSGSGTTWTDLSGNSNNGTLTNGPTFDSSNEYLAYFQFPNSNSYIQLSNPALTTPSTFSIEQWVKITDTSTNSIFLSNMDGHNDGIESGFDSSSKWSLQINGSLANISSATVNQDQWYHVVFRFDDSNLGKIFVDGVQIQSLHFGSQTINQSTASTIGAIAYQTSSVENKFEIGELRVYNNKALTATEVLQNYNAHKTRYGH